MKKGYAILMIILSLLLISCQVIYSDDGEQLKTVYISPDGDDSGTGTLSAPFRTIERGLESLEGVNGKKTMVLREGTYLLKETVVIDLETFGHDFHIKAFKDETPIITSGVELEELNRLNKNDPVWEVLTGEQRQHLRVIDLTKELHGVKHISGENGWYSYGRVDVSDIIKLSRDESEFSIESEMWLKPYTKSIAYFNSSMNDWKAYNNQEDLYLRIRNSDWNMNFLPIRNIDNTSIFTTVPGTYRLSPYEIEGEKSTWIENVIEGVNKPGTYTINTKTKKIYVWPYSDDSLVASSLSELIRFEGKNVHPLGSDEESFKNIVVEGITFRNGNYSPWELGASGAQHDWATLDKNNALLRFRGVEDSVVKECTFTHSGGVGVRFDLYARNNHVIENEFSYLGLEAIHFGGYGIGKKDDNKENLIENNVIHHIGMMKWDSPAIVIWNSGYNVIIDNIIHDIPGMGILLSAPRSRSFTNETALREQGWQLARWSEIGESAYVHVNKKGDTLVENEMTADKEYARFYRFNHGNYVGQNVLYNLNFDAGIYITAAGQEKANTINSNYFVNSKQKETHEYWDYLNEDTALSYGIYADSFLGDLEVKENVFAYSDIMFWPIYVPLWYGEGEVSSNVFYEVNLLESFVKNYVNPGFKDEEDSPDIAHFTSVHHNAVLDNLSHKDHQALSKEAIKSIIKRLEENANGLYEDQLEELIDMLNQN